MQYEDFAYDGTKSRRKELRRDIRNTLGTSSDAAPHVWNALHAARSLSSLLELASCGRYSLTVLDKRGGERPIQDVLREVHEVREARTGS